MILSRGGTVDAHKLYRAFRGKEPSPAGLIKKRGLEQRRLASQQHDVVLGSGGPSAFTDMVPYAHESQLDRDRRQ